METLGLVGPVNQKQPRYHFRERRLLLRESRSETESRSLDSDDSLTNEDRPCYLEPWIVSLLMDYKESEAREDEQLGHVLQVVNEEWAPPHENQHPATVLHIADGHHYIKVVVTASAAEMAKGELPESGFFGILGQFIVLQNYRVCFKEATNLDNCEFYLILDQFRVMSITRKILRQRHCNKEPSMLQKIKEVWQRSFPLRPFHCSESSGSEVARESRKDQLRTLKQNVQDCLDLLDHDKLLDAKQLAVYPETKWQVERKEDKDTFTIPPQLLVITAEDEVALWRSYQSKSSPAVLYSEGSPDNEYFTAEFDESPDVSLENPWDIFPEMALSTSSETSGIQPGLPYAQQMPLAHIAEDEDTADSNSCTPNFLEPCTPVSCCNSVLVKPLERSQPLLPPYNRLSLEESVSQECRADALTSAEYANKIPSSVESIPCGQPLKNLHSPMRMAREETPQPIFGSDLSPGPLPENVEEDCLTRLQKGKLVLREAGEKCLDTNRKCLAAKKKLMELDEEPVEAFSNSTPIRQRTLEPSSTGVSPKPDKLERKRVLSELSLKFGSTSTPKKSRIEETQVQRASASCRFSERLLEKTKEQTVAEEIAKRPSFSWNEQSGAQQQDCVNRAPFNVACSPAIPEIYSQVRSTRISRALLGWARWIFSNKQ